MDINKIIKFINEFKDTFLLKDWVWRKGQIDAIVEIIKTYFDGNYQYVILDSPVGSGKSVLAMCASWILNQNGKKGYILASDIALQDQYEKDFKTFNINWGTIKGVDNYKCIDNMDKHSLGTCKIRNKAPQSMSCYSECPYFEARSKASKSLTSSLNYAYWLIMMNYVNGRADKEKELFPPREFTFCDEAHKILDIVQNHYSPRFDKKTLEKIDKLKDFFNLHHVKDHTHNYLNIKESINKIKIEEDQDKLLNLLSDIEINLKAFLTSVEVLKSKVQKDYPKDTPPKSWREALRISDWIKDVHCKVEDYVGIISSTSSRNLIKNPQSEDEIVFNCLEENYMIHKYFHKWSKFTIFMSATFSDPLVYMKNIAISKAKYIKVENTFDFTNSPIYFYNKRKMSYTQIDNHMPWMFKTIDSILDKHPNENGIIHTASYHLTMKIQNNLSKENKKRLLVYSGTEEKRQVLEILKRNKSKVLIGPSLMEGIDLKNDWSRFQIIAKIPYPSLGDRFIKTKLNINPSWYHWTTSLRVIQSIGRSVRNEDDWAITYILDASLADLIHKNRKAFPIEFIQRLKIVSE